MHPTRKRLTLVLAIALACIALDQATKVLAQAYLPAHTLHLFGDIVRLHLSENTGAFLSLGARLSPELRFWIFTVISTGLLVGVSVYAIGTPELGRDVIVALACVAGGGGGNLIDRITREGRVVDFLNFGLGSLLRTGILNVADIFITFGALYVIGAGIRAELVNQQTGE